MGRVMTAGDEYWTEVSGILYKGRKSWGQMSFIFYRGGGRSKGVGSLIQGVIPGGVAVWGGDVGPDPQHVAVPE